MVSPRTDASASVCRQLRLTLDANRSVSTGSYEMSNPLFGSLVARAFLPILEIELRRGSKSSIDEVFRRLSKASSVIGLGAFLHARRRTNHLDFKSFRLFITDL